MVEFGLEDLVEDADRFFVDEQDVSDELMWWKCRLGHEWQASRSVRSAPEDVGWELGL